MFQLAKGAGAESIASVRARLATRDRRAPTAMSKASGTKSAWRIERRRPCIGVCKQRGAPRQPLTTSRLTKLERVHTYRSERPRIFAVTRAFGLDIATG